MKDSVLSTYNYEMFKFKDWNRKIDYNNLKSIDREYKRNGWRKQPIYVDENNYVYDGQHRLFYAKTHGLPVYYIVINGLGKEDTLIMNTTRKKWEAKDYINFYARQGNDNYIRLEKLCEEFDFIPPSIILSAGNTTSYGGHQQKSVQNGNLVITEELYEYLEKKLKYYRKCLPYLAEIKGRTSQLFNAIGFCYDFDQVDNDRLFKAIQTRLKTIAPPANLEWALRGIEDIYNYHSKGDHIFILTEYKKSIAKTSDRSRLYRNAEHRFGERKTR